MMLKVIGIVVLALVAIILVVVAVGFALPQDHVASREAVIKATPDAVFAAMMDVARHPDWRPGVQRIEILETSPLRWKEHSGGDVITFEATTVRPPELLVTKIADPALPFGGTWTYELKPEGESTRVTITERGEVYNPVFRFMSRFVFGHTASIAAYLEALGRRNWGG